MAAPTSNNEVTARRLTRLLTGSDGNGGLWGKVKDKISSSINALDVSSVGGAGKYISAISETDGKISATATTMDTSPTASSTNAVTSGGVKTALDGKAPTSHASSATTYGIGTTANYGHVKLATGDMNGATHADGVAVSKNHTHSQYAPIASPALTGTPTAPTATAGTNTTQIATTAFVNTAISNGQYIIPDAYCDTAAGTAAKTAKCAGFALASHQKIPFRIQFTNNNSSAGQLTLSVNGTTAKNLFINGSNSSSSNYTINAGIYWCVYDGTQYLLTTDKSFGGAFIARDGTIQAPREAYLNWGGRNITSAYSPIDAAMVSDLGANRLMFGNGAGVTVEYTRDGGTTWTDYGLATIDRSAIFSVGYSIRIGKSDSTNNAIKVGTDNYKNYKVRVTITTNSFGVYTQLNKFVIYCSTSGSQGPKVTLTARTKANKDAGNDTWTNCGSMTLGGWSGYNVLNTSNITTYGNQNSHFQELRFLFEDTVAPTNSGSEQYLGLAISRIIGFGGVGWTCPSNMARNGHLYTYNAWQDAVFPATITATKFIGPLQGNADTATTANNYNTTTGTIKTKFDSKEDFAAITTSGIIGDTNGEPTVADVKTYFNGLPDNYSRIVYKRVGYERTLIFGRGSTNNGHIFSIGNNDKYLRIIRNNAGTWSTDWEKISAGYSDTSGSAGKLTTARKTYVTLGTASTSTTRDWSGDTTIPVDGQLNVANGGTGKASVTANSYLKGNGTGALVERTYAEVRSDLGISAGANKVEASTTNGKIKIDGTETTVYTHPTYTAQTSKGSATKVPQITTDSTGHVTGITEVTITGVTPASHTHGNITNGGALQTNDVTIASGDKLVITDSSDSNKVARASISFDGSTATKALTQKGTWETFNNYTHPTTSGNKHVPSGGSSGQFLGWSADGTAAWVANPNTDTKVTAVGNHYTPSGGTSKDASGGSATQLPTSSTGTLIQVVTGVTVDAAGHVTGVSSKGLWSPNNTYNFSGTTFYSGNQSNAEHNANNISANGVYYWTSNGPTSVNGWTEGVVDGAIYSQVHSSNWRAQISQDYRNGNLAVRGMASGTWTPWNRIVDQKSFVNGPGVNLISAIRKGGDGVRFTVTMPTDLNSGLSLTYNQTEGDSYAILVILESVALNETVTLSFDVEGLNTAGNEYFSFFMQSLTPSSKTYTVNSNGRQVFVITKTATVEVPANSMFLAFDDSPQYYTTAPSGFTIKNIKLERGSIATPYSRHPSEDQTKVYYVEGPNTFTAYSSSSTYTKWASGDAYTSSNSCQYNGVAYYCSTAITTAESWTSSHWTQVPTVDWTGTIPGLTALYTGLKIAYKIPSTRGGSSSTRLNINGLGAKTVYRNTGNTTSHLPAGTIVNLTYDGTYWKWADYADGNDWVTSMGGYCSTAGATQAKGVSSSNTVLTAGMAMLVRFTNANTYDGKITMNVNSQGAKDIWINGAVSSSSNKTLPAGEHWCFYDGSKWSIWTNGTVQFKGVHADSYEAKYISNANDAIPPYVTTSSNGGAFGDFVIPSSSPNIPVDGYNWHIHAIIFRNGTNYRLTQIATASTSGVISLTYERNAWSSDGTTWTFATAWTEILTSNSTVAAGKISGTVANATTASKLGTADKGSGTKPIYLAAGVATECSTYAGGTAVTLNNASKAASTASFYAPTAGGTANYVLIGNGTTSAPTWAEKAPKASVADSATSATTATNSNNSAVTAATTTKLYLIGAAGSSGNQALKTDTGIYATTNAGELNATKYKINEACTMQYNSSTLSVDFVF